MSKFELCGLEMSGQTDGCQEQIASPPPRALWELAGGLLMFGKYDI